MNYGQEDEYKKVCQKCNTPGLAWTQVSGQWRLVDRAGVLHVCPQNQQTGGQQTPKPQQNAKKPYTPKAGPDAEKVNTVAMMACELYIGARANSPSEAVLMAIGIYNQTVDQIKGAR